MGMARLFVSIPTPSAVDGKPLANFRWSRYRWEPLFGLVDSLLYGALKHSPPYRRSTYDPQLMPIARKARTTVQQFGNCSGLERHGSFCPRTALAVTNDHVDIVVHNYRWRAASDGCLRKIRTLLLRRSPTLPALEAWPGQACSLGSDLRLPGQKPIALVGPQ